MAARRIGIVGFGNIGSYVYQHFVDNPEVGIEIAFVYDLMKERLEGLPEGLALDRIEDFASRDVDMVCEFAHRNVSAQYGTMFLSKVDYLPLSVTAFADAKLEKDLVTTSLKTGTTLYVPHGGVVGLDTIYEGRDVWTKVRFVMKKHPRNIDFAASDFDPATIKGETVVYEGPTRGACIKYPRNVNTHAAVALAGIGFDRTQSVLVADPARDFADLTIYAESDDVQLQLWQADRVKGVTGMAAVRSVIHSIGRTAEARPGLHFC